MSTPILTQTNPYIGPRAFQINERLYGRDRERTRLLNILIAERIVVLYSPSGAGKTSLIQAGLIPALANEDFRVQPVIRVGLDTRSLLPAEPAASARDSLLSTLLQNRSANTESAGAPNRYVLSTMLSLEALRRPEQQQPLATLARLTLPEYFARRLTKADPSIAVVLIFDQFEEILTVDPADEAAKHVFFAQVGELLRDRRFWALFALREDYLAGLDPFVRPIPTRLTTRYRLDLLTAEAAHQAIRRPARRRGVDFTNEAVSKLVDDLRTTRIQLPSGEVATQPGMYVEPVQLQVVCYRLWERRFENSDLPDPAGSHIVVEDIAAAGDVNQVLAEYYAEHVEGIAAATGVSERAIRDWVDRQLITDQETRGQVLHATTSSAGLNNRAIALFIEAHLVRAEKRGGATWYELAHDRLIEPIRADNLRWREAHLSMFQRQSALWDQQGRPDGLLLRDAALTDAEAWADAHGADVSPVDAEFLQRCRQARKVAERERRRNLWILRLGIGAFVLFLCASAALVFAINRQQEAVRQQLIADDARGEAVKQRDNAEARGRAARSSEARLLAAQATSVITTNSELGVLLALEAAEREQLAIAGTSEQHSPAVEAALRAVATRAPARYYSHTSALASLGLPDRAFWEDASLQNADVHAAALSPDGARIASAVARFGFVRDVEGGDVTVLSGHDKPIRQISFSPDSQRIVTASDDGTVRIWDANTGYGLAIFRDHQAPVSTATWSHDGTWVASADVEGGILFWRVDSGAQEQQIAHTSPVSRVAFSNDDRQLVVADGDGWITVYDIQTGESRWSYPAHPIATSAAWSPDDRSIVSTGIDSVLIWDADTGELKAELKRQSDASVGNTGLVSPAQAHSEDANDASFSPDGKRIVTAGRGGDLVVWDSTTGQEIQLLPKPDTELYTAAFDAAGTHVLAAGSNNYMPLWSLGIPSLRSQAGRLNDAAISPDGHMAVTAGEDGSIGIWDATNGVQLRLLRGHLGPVSALSYNHDGSLIASAGYDGTAKLWNSTTGGELRTLRGHTGAIRSVAWSPTEEQLVTASSDGTVRIWDAATGTEQSVFPNHDDVGSASFSPDGTKLLIAGPQAAQVWNIASQQLEHSFEGSLDGVWKATYSPSGQQIVAVSGRADALVWNTETQALEYTLPAEAAALLSAEYSPEGDRIVTGSADGTVQVWDAATGTKLASMRRTTATALYARFDPTGQHIIIANADGSAFIEYARFEDALAFVRQLKLRDFTLAERASILGE